MRIYPDTIIWNLLCDQGVVPEMLLDSLGAKGATLAVSFHTVYELARNFQHDDEKGNARGRRLFAYLKKYLDLGIPNTKELWELIVEEAYALENSLSEIDPMATAEQCDTTRVEVYKLADGIVEDRVKQFLEQRFRFSEDTKEQQKNHIADRDELKRHLQGISDAALPQWLQAETSNAMGVNMLYRHLVKILPGPQFTLGYAHCLLSYALADASRAIVRADLYSNWRCAKHGSNRRDLIDDMLHVLQATYCDLYVTEEKKQINYAHLLLTPRTRVEVYPCRSTPIDRWLASLV